MKRLVRWLMLNLFEMDTYRVVACEISVHKNYQVQIDLRVLPRWWTTETDRKEIADKVTKEIEDSIVQHMGYIINVTTVKE